MRRRLHLGLIAGLALLLAACGPPAVEAPADGTAAASATSDRPALAPAGGSVAIQAGTASASCPTTRPPDPPFVPPAPYPPTPPPLYGDMFWYGTNGLWTWLHANGTWSMARGLGAVRFDKSFWWREGYDWQTETTPRLQLTGRRLDAAAPRVTISEATNGFRDDIGAFMLIGLELPTGGCWELTGHYAGRSLRFVVRVN